MMMKGERITYFISNVGTCSLSVIDGNNFDMIKEIKLDSRPQKIFIDDRNNVFVACDRSNRITCIHSLNSVNQSWDIPNNGNIHVDSIAQKIYVCNAEEICIYNLKNGEVIKKISGFIAANCLKLDNSKKRLFVLDVLEKVIKVFSTDNYKVIRVYRNVGITPSEFIIEAEEKYLYVANKGLNRKDTGNICIVDIATGNITYIKMEHNAVIAALVQKGNYLFVANNGLHHIDVIDLLSKKSITSIKTTLPLVKRLRLISDSNLLLAISLDKEGNGAIDRIDTEKNVIVDTFFMEEKYLPYDIGVVIQKEEKVENNPRNVLPIENRWNRGKWKKERRKVQTFDCEINRFNDCRCNSINCLSSENLWNKENGLNILAKEVISLYQERVIFHPVTSEISTEEIDLIDVDEVSFQKCEMISESIECRTIKNRREYSELKYDFYIPYTFAYKERQEKAYALKGKIKESHKAILFIPAITSQLGVEFVSTTCAKLISTPVYNGNRIIFEVSVLISTLVIIDKTVFVPN
jgi:DNA-binding beta-propeller fold protein YncE